MSLTFHESPSFEQLVEQGASFAFYRSPGDTDIHFVAQHEGEISTFYDLDELNGKSGFVVAPFSCDNKTPICLIRQDVCKQMPAPIIDLSAKAQSLQFDPCLSVYAEKFGLFSEALSGGQFEKLVLSRNKVIQNTEALNLLEAYYKACRIYPNSYVYLLYTPITGIWMGCSPEILLSGSKGEWKTVALAGTQSAANNENNPKWDQKNIDEQSYVSSYIRRQLQSLGIQANERGPHSVKAGPLLHLRTDFEFQLGDKGKLGSLLKLLHPTPAVCGLPKAEAYKFILENEGYDRKYYSGFIGMLNPEADTNLYVNLRCLAIEGQRMTYYAGGGLLAASDREEEWIETEKKMSTMMNIFNEED